MNEFLHFGHVSDWSDWLALTGFVELSSSPCRIFDDTPGLIGPGSDCHQFGSSLRQMG